MNQTQSHATATEAYEQINSKANQNSFVQGITGFAGFPLTLAVDVGSIPLVYADLWNDIRRLYGHAPVGTTGLVKIVTELVPEVLTDLVVDKALGNIPVVGVYFNAICAKAMTWRLGTLFAMLSARGEDIPIPSVRKAMELIRTTFPQQDMFKFATPEQSRYLELVLAVGGVSPQDFDDKIERALRAMRDR